MHLTIFSRLMTGYVALLLLATGVSVYAIIQLRHVQKVTQSVIATDNPLLDLHKDLSDALLSEQRYEKKYLIMRDDLLHRGFQRSRDEFERHLRDALRMAGKDQRAVLARASRLHFTYQSLVREEAGFVRAGRPYGEGWYYNEKEKIVNALVDELSKLRALSQKNIVNKVKQLSDAGGRATRAAMATTAAAAGVMIILSLLITASITRPLGLMKKKMAEISSGVHDPGLQIASPPEIAELGRTFNYMCGRLKELDLLKSDFYALMSHELRTPLTAIKESTSLFLEGRGGAVTDKQKRLLAIMAEESNRLIDLVNSLLDLSRLEAGMVSYHPVRQDLNRLISRALSEVEPLAEAKGIRIESDLKDLPAVAADPERILQVLRNLLGNALKFTPRDGRVTLSSAATEKGAAVSVTDTGPGIAPADAAIIFDKYRQAAAAGLPKVPGTGLGLAIVKHIVQDHGGTVWVTSDGTRGSTFTFVLPS
jgi:two-component system sensor histidine kinase GlrK